MFFVGYKPSSFYANFFLRDLVNNSKSPSAMILTKNSGDGGLGAGGTGISQKSFGSFNSNQYFSAYIQSPALNDFDQAELMKSLQNDIQKHLTDSGAEINIYTEINPPSFQIDYNYSDKILGYINISGGFGGGNIFRLKAKLHEISKNKEKPVIEREDFIYKPTGNYYIVAFKEDNAEAQNFWKKGQLASEESLNKFQKKLPRELSKQTDLINNLQQIVVYTWRPFPIQLPTDMKQELKEAMYGDYEIPIEYHKYGIVYFLNELALQMYNEIGEEFEILKTVSAEEAAKIALHPTLQGYYIPKNEQ